MGDLRHREFLFDEDHTLGSLLQRYCDPLCAFVAYQKVHPLEMRVRLKVSSPDPRASLAEACARVKKDVGVALRELRAREEEGAP